MADIKVSNMPEILKSEISDDDVILITDISETGSKKSKALTIKNLKSVCKDVVDETVIEVDECKKDLDDIVSKSDSVEVTVHNELKKFTDLTDEEIDYLTPGQLAKSLRTLLRILSKHNNE